MEKHYDDKSIGEHKTIMVGHKYTKDDAIDQIEAVINSILSHTNKTEQDFFNPEEEEAEKDYRDLPVLLLDQVLENPFLFDLMKSETFDWEINDMLYKNN